jgi:hypothetical protein
LPSGRRLEWIEGKRGLKERLGLQEAMPGNRSQTSTNEQFRTRRQPHEH